MRLHWSSCLHVATCCALLYTAALQLSAVLTLHSEFPADILAELAHISFHNFNNETGSFQTITPSIAHYFLFDTQVFSMYINENRC